MGLSALPALGNTSWYSYAGEIHDQVNKTFGKPAIIVASDDASDDVKNYSDYVCDGTADDVQINAAIEEASPLQANDTAEVAGTNRAVAAGTQAGHVILTGGEFNLANSVLQRTGVWLQGSGPLTYLRDANISASTGYGTPVAMIKKYDQYTHLTKVSDMTLYGNYATGGAGHGIYYENLDDLDSYPATDPDPYDKIHDMYLYGFTTGTRNGIHVAGTNTRGVQISHIIVRYFSGSGIYIDGPDGDITACHVGTLSTGATGFNINGGNYRISTCKAFYCDTGFAFANSRMVAANLEIQDCVNGATFTASDVIVEGLHVDNCDTTGITISASRVKLSFMLHQRSGGRFANMDTGISFTGTQIGLNVQGVINATNVTTPVSGTTSGSANFIRISHGSTLVSEG